MARILLTGVTGVVGSALAPLLRREGHQIYYLVRPRNGQMPDERLREVIGDLTPNDVVVAGDITDLDSIVCDPVDKVVHGAASVKFDESRREEIYQTNLHGTRNMLELATRLGASEFHYVSSAYVAGDADFLSEGEVSGGSPRNPYEGSKLEAEHLVREWFAGQFSIYRPSVIVGHSQTGEIRSFDGYYGYFIPFWRLLQTWRQKWEDDQKSCLTQGVEFTEDLLALSLQMDCSPISTINLVPVDWMAEMLAKLIDKSAVGQTFHLTDSRPQRVQWVIDTSLQILGIVGFRYGSTQEEQSSPMLARLQRMLNRDFERYRPYAVHESMFATGHAAQTLGQEFSDPPEVNVDLLERLLHHACEIDFGRKVREVRAT